MRLVSRPRSFAVTVGVTLLVAGALAGCSTPYKTPAFASNSGNTRFEGIVC
jgi:outer membrane protein assembly factor BamE (lipoprotein component of BamABCDE complex)